MMIPDVLANACHPAISRRWSPIELVRLERMMWVTIADIQQKLGVNIHPDDVRRGACLVYEGGDDDLLARIDAQERKTRHDLKARLDVFCEDTGLQIWHLGCTSADIVENTYQIRVASTLQALAMEWPEMRERVDSMLDRYPLRGIKGAMGTMQDQIDLLGSEDKAAQLDRRFTARMGFAGAVTAIGQVNHRSLDLMVATELQAAVAGCRLHALVDGFVTMLAGIAGNTWNEGDVSHSVVRRVALLGVLFATDVCLRDGPYTS